jgi:choline dehydrogenase-like flavoprotein
MFGGGGSARGTFEEPLYDYKSVQVTRMLEDFYDADPKRGFYGGGQIDGRGGVQPIAYGIGGGGGGPRWGAGFKQSLRENYNHTMTLQFFSTNLPLETNNVTLDPELKDAWGLPAIRVTFKEHPDDMKTKAFLRERCLEILDATGAKTKSAPPPVEARSGHLMGACRMGNDPKTSVVDRYHRAHEIPNLFVVDGSSFVTSARNHPTITIEALAYRAAEHMVRTAKNGELKSSA